MQKESDYVQLPVFVLRLILPCYLGRINAIIVSWVSHSPPIRPFVEGSLIETLEFIYVGWSDMSATVYLDLFIPITEKTLELFRIFLVV